MNMHIKSAEKMTEARAFSYYMHDGPTGFTIELAGTLDAERATKVKQDWPSDRAAVGKKELVVDLPVVTQIDPVERRLLRRWLKNVPNIDFNQPLHLALWSQNGRYRVYINGEGIADRRDYRQEIA